MKKGFWIITGLALITAIMCSIGPPKDQENSATVIETVNKVDAHPRPKDDWGPAEVDMAIYGGGQVRTGAASSAQLELLEGVVRLSAESIFTVKESATRQGRLETTLFLGEGRLWAHLTTSQPHEFRVETGSAVAAVRDTHFCVKADPDQTTLVSVAEGEVEVTAQGESVTVAAGQQTIVKPGQPPSPPEPMSDEEHTLWGTEGEMPELVSIPTPTSAPTPTTTATVTPTFMPVPSDTPVPTGTPTPVPVPSDTPVPTVTPTPVPPPTETSVPTDTPTLVPTPTDTPVSPAELSYLVAHDLTGIYIQAIGSDEKAYIVDAPALNPVWSPDGTTIAFSCPADNQFGWEVCLVSRDGTDRRYGTTGTKSSTEPHWLPDGQSLFVASYREESTDIWQINLYNNTWANITPGTPGSHEHFPGLVEGYEQIIFSSDRECISDLGCIVAYISNRDGSDVRLLRGSVSVWDQNYYPWRTRTVTQ